MGFVAAVPAKRWCGCIGNLLVTMGYKVVLFMPGEFPSNSHYLHEEAKWHNTLANKCFGHSFHQNAFF